MQVGLYQSVSGMKALEAYQATLASNLARQSVVGARSTSMAFELQEPPSYQYRGLFPINQTPGVKALPIQQVSVVNFSQGPLQRTERPTDFAINGEAFFAVQEPGTDGGTQIRYTRDGQFNFDSTGTLVTSDGAKVLLDNGNPVTVPANAKDKSLNVFSDGTVYLGDSRSPEGKLMLAHFEDPRQALVSTNTGRFMLANPEDKLAQDGLATNDRVEQGAVEGANINTVTEMVSMIETMRGYEANQKAVIAQDDANGKLIDSVTQGLSG